ncbi:MAG: hypothetical protein WD063_08775 [Pirellulales bacterium]
MSSTSAATIASPSGLARRVRAVGVRAFAVWTLFCGAWFVGGSELWAIDLDGNLRIQKRDDSVRDLDGARETVEKARAEAVAARARLDAFLSHHFEEQRRRQPPRPVHQPEPNADAELRPDPELARLKTQVQEFREHREQLLGYLTEEHPQVFDVDGRIAAIEQRIASLAGVSLESDGQTERPTTEAAKSWGDYVNGLARQAEEDSAAYRELYDRWQAAESVVDDALAAERAVSQRLEAIARPKPQLVEPAPPENSPADWLRDLSGARPNDGADDKLDRTPAAESRDAAATAAGSSSSESDSAGSQPLAIAALLIALAVAALTAVRLARSTADPIFASVDETAAALAIPVVGIIPATPARLQQAGSAASTRRSSVILLGQILVAAVVFAAVACALQNPGDVWRLCTHPLEALGLIRGH